MRYLVPAVVLSSLLVAGCTVGGSGDGDVGAGADPGQPEATASASAGGAAGLTPLAQPPRDSRQVGADFYTLAAPATFQQSERPGPGGLPMLVLSGPAEDPGSVAEVVAFTDPEATAPVADQMSGLVAQLVDLRGVEDVQRESVEWPGTTAAVLVRWTEDTATADGTVTQTFAQMAVETEDGRSATVIAVAPSAEFESSGVLDVLRTFDVTGG